MKKNSIITLAAAVLFMAESPAAGFHNDEIQKILPEIKAAVVQQDTIDALRASNRVRKAMAQTDFDRLTATWQSELVSQDHPLISSVIGNPLAMRMRGVMEVSSGLINEIGVIDAAGLEIAQTNALSDYWQGGDERFNRTFRAGPNAEFVDLIEYDSPTQSIGSQANFSVADPDTGEVIGMVTINFNLANLE